MGQSRLRAHGWSCRPVIPVLASHSAPHGDLGTEPWLPRLARARHWECSPGQDVNPRNADQCPTGAGRLERPASFPGAELWVHAVRGPHVLAGATPFSFQRLLGHSASKLPEAGFRTSPSEPSKGPERVSRRFSGQLPSWALSWPQAVAVFPLSAALQARGSVPRGPFPAQPTPDPGLPPAEAP